MKRECSQIQNKIIDMYYNEFTNDSTKPNSHIENCSVCSAFRKKLELSLNYMDSLDTIPDIPDLQVNIAELIEKANELKNKRKNKLELFLFITTSLIFSLSSILFVANLDIKLLVYIQIFLYFNLPLVLIPLYKLKLSRR
ncbi:MAG TPA: YxlC family protein [Clostridia bacterium]|nr:YxlC family protein [Clostridia bacterium]